MQGTKRDLAVAAAFVAVFLPNYLDGYFKADLFQWSPQYFWLFDFTKFVLIPGVCLVALATWSDVKPRHYGLGRPALSGAQLLAAGIVVTLVMKGIYYYASHLAWRAFDVPAPAFSYSQTIPPGWTGKLVAVYFAGTAAFVEEIYYRGLPWLLLGSRDTSGMRKLAYVLISSGFFAAIHWENGTPELVATFIYGVAACLWYLRLGTLWPLVLAHFVIDLWVFG